MMRIAAVGDVHVGTDSHGLLRHAVEGMHEHADVLLVAGDLTQMGTVEEARVLADELRPAAVPVVAVLGNHDHHADDALGVTKALEDAGVTVLEGTATTLELPGGRLGVAGVKGFGGGFAGACGTDFGEPEMKAFVRHTAGRARALREALAALDDVDVRIALTHYAPVKDTLLGEKLEIYPFLGSYLLGEAADAVGADLVVHGHAHHGSEKGITPGGIRVRNVAHPVIGRPYDVFCLEPRDRRTRAVEPGETRPASDGGAGHEGSSLTRTARSSSE